MKSWLRLGVLILIFSFSSSCVCAAIPAQLTMTSQAAQLETDASAGVRVTLSVQDEPTEPTLITITSSSPTGIFSADTSSASSVYTIPWHSGDTTQSITYKDMTPGSPTLRAILASADGTEYAHTSTSLIVTDATAPAVPHGLGTTIITAATVIWEGVPDALGPVTYDVRVASSVEKLSDNSASETMEYTTVDTHWTLGELERGTMFWQVRARDALGNTSDWSPPQSFSVDPFTPQVLGDSNTLPTITPLAATITAASTSELNTKVSQSLSNAAKVTIASADQTQTNDPSLLRVADLPGITQTSSPSIDATVSGWKLFTVSWYWWLAGLIIIVFAGRALVRLVYRPTPARV